MPKVTVVIPTYNNATYIKETVESILAQEYNHYEIIVIDDGSTDDTREVLSPYIPLIRYNYQENHGLAVARNRGLDLASGEYITYLDGDDTWRKDNLAAKVALLEEDQDLGAVFSDFCIFNENGIIHSRGTVNLFPVFKRTKWTFRDIFPNCKTVCIPSGKEVEFLWGLVFDKLFFGNFILPSSMIFRKSFAVKTGKFRSHMRTQQDYEYWLRFTRRYPVGYLDEVLVNYRRHADQLTNISNIERIYRTVIEIIDQYQEEFTSRDRSRAFYRRKAELLNNLALVNMGTGRNREARQILLESIKMDPFIIRNQICYFLTYMPASIIVRLRKIRKWVLNQ